MDQITSVDLTSKKNIEIASISDIDLMRIKCYALNEGENENGMVFPRDKILSSYKTLIDKPVIIVPDKYGFPTGHAFDFNTGTFNEDKRKRIGHITNAYPVIVKDTLITCIDEQKLNDDSYKFPDGQLRIIVEMVVYKNYLIKIADVIEYLHNINDLFFSIESLVIKNDNECEKIHFMGLAVVANPAFVEAKSIEIAEKIIKKEEKKVDYEKAYNELKEKYDALKKQLESSRSGKNPEDEKKEKETAEKLEKASEKIADLTKELAEVKTSCEALKEYKDKFEVAEKKAIGKERAEKLKKLGVEKDEKELSELTVIEFAELIIKESENFKSSDEDDDIEVAEQRFTSHGKKSDKEILDEALKKLMEEE